MFNSWKHKSVLLTGLVLVALAAACEGPGSALERQFLGPPTATPNMEATVEARVEEAIAAIPPLPTYTPVPTYTPAPKPSPEVIIKEIEVTKAVIVEKEVPIEKIVTVKVELTADPLPTYTPAPVEVVELIVEKIVQVMVTSIPSPIPTSTLTPTPVLQVVALTATPLPSAEASPMDYIFVEQGHTTYVRDCDETGNTMASHDNRFGCDYKYRTALITNNHPSRPIKAAFSLDIKNDDGYITGQTLYRSMEPFACIMPDDTHILRYVIPNTKTYLLEAYPDEAVFCDQSWLTFEGAYLYEEEIHESVANKVQIDITRNTPYWTIDNYRDRIYNVVISNNSTDNIWWGGMLTIEDIYGNIVSQNFKWSQCVRPNVRKEVSVFWNGASSTFQGMILTGTDNPPHWVKDGYNKGFDDFILKQPTLKTHKLLKRNC